MNDSSIDIFNIKELCEPGHTPAWDFLTQFLYAWEALPFIREFILQSGPVLDSSEYEKRSDNVWIHKTAIIAPSAFIGNSVIIGAGTEVRHGAFIRENALIGCNAVIGNSTEIKNAILFDNVQAPHYNYIGDSILGYKSHMGAGSITSNVKNDHELVAVVCGDVRIETGLKKFGAIIGDHVEVGCNSVLNPGSVVGAGVSIYPLSFVRGFIPPGTIYKRAGEVAEKN